MQANRKWESAAALNKVCVPGGGVRWTLLERNGLTAEDVKSGRATDHPEITPETMLLVLNCLLNTELQSALSYFLKS